MTRRNTTPLLLSPALQRYAWADARYIADLLQLDGAEEPIAEAWYGAHPVAPAMARPLDDASAAERPLDALLATDDASFELPYLLKILAAGQPLSIQVHPTKQQAETGYEREEQAAIPRVAATRSYRDKNHKPEILVALKPTYALCGFRSAEGVAEALSVLPEIAALLPAYDGTPDGSRALLEAYFELADAELEPALGAVLERLREQHGRQPFGCDAPGYWALEAQKALDAAGESRPDRGLLFVFLLELIRLEEGQAVFLPAGVPHAYLRGAGVELMAASDNVLRAGLTPKHVDPEELLAVVRFDAARPPVLEAVADNEGIARYPVPARELEIGRLALAPGERRTIVAEGMQTLLVTSADAGASLGLTYEGETQALAVGQAVLLPDGAEVSLEGEGVTVFLAGCPGGAGEVGLFRGRRPTELAFGTSGLRGLVEDITDLEAYINTRGFLDMLISRGDAVYGTEVAIGGDLRPSTDSPERSIKRAVARAIVDSGMRPVECGRLPTPALTLYGISRSVPSVMVTGSHIPFDRNGIKFNRPDGEVLKSDEADILAAVARVRRREYCRSPETSIFDDGGWIRPEERRELPTSSGEAIAAYRQRYRQAFPTGALRGLRLGFYEHSAVGRELVADILRDLGAEVIPFGRSESFVAIDTEAIAAERLEELQRWADELRAEHGRIDALLSTDGDSDRPMLLGLDEAGKVHFFGGDVLGAVVAQSLVVDAVALPISANDMIDELFGANADVSLRHTRIGSPWVIAAMAEMEGARRVGWEANGGFLTGTAMDLEGTTLAALPTRDAVLPLVAALHAAHSESLTLVERFAQLPRRFSRAGLLDEVPPAESRAILRCYGLPEGMRKVTFGGVGVEIAAEDHRGVSIALDQAVLAASRALKDRLEAVFGADEGFGALTSIDVLDGIRLRFDNGDVAHVRPSGNAPQLRIYAVADSVERAEEIVSRGLADPRGILRRLAALAASADSAEEEPFVAAIRANIRVMERLFAEDRPAAVIGTVAGSAAAQRFWQRQLDIARKDFRARAAISFHEDLPVNQAFGLLLLWQRLREQLQQGEGALVAFVFGEGTRATPLTEAEGGQKPAIASFAATEMGAGEGKRYLSTVELAMRTFAPVEAYLRRSGFEGMVVKWGDEVQIPTRDLSASDPLFEDADVVRFVSLREMSEDEAANKDWVGVAADGRVTAFIPRRSLAEMAPLADRGLLQRRGEKLFGGVNLGSIALSRALCEVLLEEFRDEVNDPAAERKMRPDLDPQLFTALTVAAIDDAEKRASQWAICLEESAAMRSLEANLPAVLGRLRGALERFEARHGRPIKMVALDFGDQYWGDIGQHAKLRELYMALREESMVGQIARSLAGVSEVALDDAGNLIAGDTRLGEGVEVRGSVLIDVVVDRGTIVDSVLIGSRVGEIEAEGAFDLHSCVSSLSLAQRSGSYKVISATAQRVEVGGRLTTVFLDGSGVQLRIHEDTDLRDREVSYERALGDNPLSFAEVHRRVLEVDPEELQRRRTAARREVAAKL